jgi:hypothetical protein
MQDTMTTPKQLIGKQLFCTQTNMFVTILEHQTDYWNGSETFEGLRVQYPDGMKHIINVCRLGRDYTIPTFAFNPVTKETNLTKKAPLEPFVLASLFEVPELEPVTPDFVYDHDMTLQEQVTIWKLAA